MTEFQYEYEFNGNNNTQLLQVLHLLKQASHHLRLNRLTDYNSTSIKALLELETQSNTILSDPTLSQLSRHLSYLKGLVVNLRKTRGYGLGSFLRRRLSLYQISRVAYCIECELQAWIDREFLECLVKAFHGSEEDELIQMLVQFQERLLQGFDRELQDLLLKSRVFSELETVLTNPGYSVRLREESAFAIDALIRFNKNVFVGQVLMGPTTKALIALGTTSTLRVLCCLINTIKSPLVDEIEGNGQIETIIGYMMSSEETEKRDIGLECVMEIGYYGRKEAVDAMMKAGVVEKLVKLQMSEKEEDLYARCVARFAVELEVGEGLRQREKRAFKQEILCRIKDASLSDAEAATLHAQVLWGTFSWEH